MDIIKVLVTNEKFDINQTNKIFEGSGICYNSLLIIIPYFKEEIITNLISELTPLQIANMNNDSECIQFLLEQKSISV